MLIERKYLFSAVWLLYFSILGIVAATTPITPSEAYGFYHSSSITTFLMHIGYILFPSEFGLRIFFLFFAMLNALLYERVTASFVSRSEDRYVIVMIYLILPGVVASSILANSAVILSFLVLLFLYAYMKKNWLVVTLSLLLLSVVHWSALFLYGILLLYAANRRERWLLIVTIIAVIFYTFSGMEMPLPRDTNNVLELLSIYATVFSPLVFIYLFYVLYRTLLRGERNIIWYISFYSLIISLILSFIYRIRIVDFSPYIMLGTMLMIQSYHASLRVRMRRFQNRYRWVFKIVTISLIVSTLSILLNKPIYRTVGKEYYALFAPVYAPYDRAKELRSEGKSCVNGIGGKQMDQMKFYQINRCF